MELHRLATVSCRHHRMPSGHSDQASVTRGCHVLFPSLVLSSHLLKLSLLFACLSSVLEYSLHGSRGLVLCCALGTPST